MEKFGSEEGQQQLCRRCTGDIVSFEVGCITQSSLDWFEILFIMLHKPAFGVFSIARFAGQCGVRPGAAPPGLRPPVSAARQLRVR